MGDKITLKNLLIKEAKEKELHDIVRDYKKRNWILEALYFLRSKSKFKLSEEQWCKEHKTSRNKLFRFKKTYPYILTDNHLFRDFLAEIGINAKDNLTRSVLNAQKNKAKKKKIKQEELNNKLQEEMDKARLIINELNQENVPITKQYELSQKWRRQVDKLNKTIMEWWVPKVDWITELYDINWKILAKWKEVILSKLDELDPKSFNEVKALSDILDTAFKQNRLIEWKSTDNVAVWVQDIYDYVVEQNTTQDNIIDAPEA